MRPPFVALVRESHTIKNYIIFHNRTWQFPSPHIYFSTRNTDQSVAINSGCQSSPLSEFRGNKNALTHASRVPPEPNGNHAHFWFSIMHIVTSLYTHNPAPSFSSSSTPHIANNAWGCKGVDPPVIVVRGFDLDTRCSVWVTFWRLHFVLRLSCTPNKMFSCTISMSNIYIYIMCNTWWHESGAHG